MLLVVFLLPLPIHLEFQQIRGVAGLQATLESARAQSKPVLLDFYADWCISCKELDAYTFTDNNVQSTLDGFILIQTDVTENNQEDQELLTSLGLFGPPALLFFDNNGQEHKPSRLVGFIEAPAFVEHINRFKLKNWTVFELKSSNYHENGGIICKLAHK